MLTQVKPSWKQRISTPGKMIKNMAAFLWISSQPGTMQNLAASSSSGRKKTLNCVMHLSLLLLVLFISACSDDDNDMNDPSPSGIKTSGFVFVGTTGSGSASVKYAEELPVGSIDLSDGLDFPGFFPNSVYDHALFLARPGENTAGFSKYVVNENGELEERGILSASESSSFRIDVRDAQVGVFQDLATPDQITVFNPTTFQVTTTIDMTDGFVPGDIAQRYQRFIFRGDDVFSFIRGPLGVVEAFPSFIIHQADLSTNTFVGDTQREGNGINTINTSNNFGQNLLDDEGNLYIEDIGNFDGVGIAARVNKIPAGSNEIDPNYVFEPAVVLNPQNAFLPAFNSFSIVSGKQAIAKVNATTPQEAIDVLIAAGGVDNLSLEQRQQIFGILSRAESARWCELDLEALTVTPIEGIPSSGVFGFASTFRFNGEIYISINRESGDAVYRWNPSTGEASKAFDVTGSVDIQGIFNLANNN